MKERNKPSKKTILAHETCTSTPLDSTPGSQPEHISIDVLNKLHEEQTGTKISKNHATAVIQREQAIIRHKRASR